MVWISVKTIYLVLAEEEAVRNINSFLVDDGSSEDLCKELKRMEACLPKINENISVVYHRELVEMKKQAGRVSSSRL